MVRWPELCGARRQLVDEDAAVAGEEQLDAQDADDVERFERRARDRQRVALDLRRHPRRRDRDVEDVPGVRVLDDAVVRDAAVDAARGDHRQLALEVDERLEDGRLAADRDPRRRAASSARSMRAWPLPS